MTRTLRTCLLLPLLLSSLLAACGDKDGDDTGSVDPGGDPGDDTGEPTDCEPAEEVCDGQDNDCDGEVDEDDAVDAATWYADGDDDGFGAPDQARAACEAPEGFVADGTDCDDGDPEVHPAAEERCETAGIDDDCDGTADEDDAVDAATWHADGDGDGYGDADSAVTTCALPSGYVEDASDCDDTDPRTHPGAVELCDGKQTDCADSSWTSDAGVAHLEDADTGAWTDVSAELGSGSSGAPAHLSLDTAGTLHVCGGTWPVSLDISADVRVVGEEGMDAVTLSGEGVATVITVSEPGLTVTLEGLTVANGLAEAEWPVYPAWYVVGGGLACLVESEITATEVRFQDNHADDEGAAVALYECDLTWTAGDLVPGELDSFSSVIHAFHSDLSISELHLADLVVPHNLIVGDGEGTIELADSSLTDVEIEGDAVILMQEDGVNESACGSASILRSTFSGGSTGYYGSLYLASEGCEGLVEDSTYEDLSSADGVLATIDDGSLTVTGSTVRDSTGGEGVAVSHYGGDTVIDGCTFEGNTGEYSGAVVFEGGTMEISNSELRDNTSTFYATVTAYNDALTIDGSTFEGNHGRYGGALYLGNPQVVISSSTFEDNSTNTSGGGAVFVSGSRESLSLEGTSVDFVDNDPDDIWFESARLTYTLGTGADFTCDSSGCE